MPEEKKKVNPTPSSIPHTDPRYPIWGRVWLCRIPRIAHYGTAYLERYGLPTSGNQNIDRELMKQAQLCYITINQMVEYYHQNTVVRIAKQHDVKVIYEICQDYTFNWAKTLQSTLFTHNVPLEDLVKIDEFAEALYQYAGYEYGEEFARTFVPEGLQKEIIDLNKMFDAIDKRVTGRHKAKDDHYTVKTKYSPKASPNFNRDEVKSQEEKKKLPERPTVRDIFLSYMDSDGKLDRYGDR